MEKHGQKGNDRLKNTSGLSDEIFGSALISMIVGLPLVRGIVVLLLPFVIVSGIIGIPVEILLQSVLVFGVAIFFVWLFSDFKL